MSAAGISITGGSAVTSEHGDMVVISDRPTIHLPDGSSQTLRMTLAGRRRLLVSALMVRACPGRVDKAARDPSPHALRK
jgi:hypothetical protein